VAYGSAAVLAARAAALGLPPLPPGRLVDTGGEPPPPGEPSAAGGRAAVDALKAAVRDALAGRVDAIATAPLSKTSLRMGGFPWPGHTELLAEAAGTADVAMMFVGGGLRVALLTIHRALASVPGALRPEEVRRILRLVDRELPRFGAGRRRIGLCGLNPHAGEGGLFGHEERSVLAPAVEAARREGVDVNGPFPADTLFVKAKRGDYDAVVACYHDQGLIPVKLAAFGRCVNVTLGLPFPRTSVDHGTAFDIAARGGADPGSLEAAIELAIELSGSRASAAS